MKKLPVLDVVGRALAAPVRFLWPLAPFYLVLQIGAVGVIGAFATVAPDAGIGVTPANIPLALLSGAVLFIASLMLVVLTHRLVAGVPDPWRLTRPTLIYALVAAAVLMILAGGSMALGFVLGLAAAAGASGGMATIAGALAGLAVWLAVMILFVRLSLALPAAALEQANPIGAAWRMSRGNALRLFGGWVLLALLCLAFAVAVSLAAGLAGIIDFPPQDRGAGGLANAFDLSDPDALGLLLVNVVVNYVLTVAGTAYLTFSYRALSEGPADTRDAPAGDTAAGTPPHGLSE